MPSSLVDWLPYLIPAVSGGLAGALVSAYINLRKQRFEIALGEVRQFIQKSPEVADVLGLLAAGTLGVHDTNRAIAVGDWMDTVAYLAARGYADRRLVEDLGLGKQLRRFRRAAEEARSSTPSLVPAFESWRYLQEFEP